MSLLSCASLTKTYASGGRELTVLSNITFAVEAGAFVAILGPSGSGKSTLLGLLAGLDRPTSGAVHLDGVAMDELSEDQRARVRGEKVGFVFQSFHLIPTLTALENVQVPLELRGQPARARAEELLARAFSHAPRIVFADEPTGNLDAATGATVIGLMAEMNRALQTTLVLVTHDPELAKQARRVIRLADGSVVSDTGDGSP